MAPDEFNRLAQVNDSCRLLNYRFRTRLGDLAAKKLMRRHAIHVVLEWNAGLILRCFQGSHLHWIV